MQNHQKTSAEPNEKTASARALIGKLQRAKRRSLLQFKQAGRDIEIQAIDHYFARKYGRSVDTQRLIRIQNEVAAYDAAIAELEVNR